jgi:Ni,Fe-hydrogenase I small subunit
VTVGILKGPSAAPQRGSGQADAERCQILIAVGDCAASGHVAMRNLGAKEALKQACKPRPVVGLIPDSSENP